MKEDIRKKIQSGQKILIGKPKEVPSAEILFAIEQTVNLLPACVEVHLLQYFIVGAMPMPRLALVFIVSEAEDRETFARFAEEIIIDKLAAKSLLDLWVLSNSDSLLPSIRAAGSLMK